MYSNLRLQKKNERLSRRIEELEKANAELVKENNNLKARESLVKKYLEELPALISSLRASKSEYDNAIRQITLEQENYRKQMQEFLAMIKPAI